MAYDSPITGNDGPSSDSWTAGRTVSAPTPKRWRKIAILGFSETVKDAPVHDPSWELWGMNGFHRAAKPDFGIDVPEERYSLWFDMHRIEYTREYGKVANIEGQQEEWLRQPHPFPILSVEARPEFPSVQPYPLDDVVAKFGRDYFTSTVAYALALALSQEDVAEVGLWGIDLAHTSEYADQRPCAEFYCGWAEGHGIKVTIHEKSALLSQRHRYGYSEGDPLLVDMLDGVDRQIALLEKKLAELAVAREQLDSERHTNDGALQLAKVLKERLQLYSRGGRI